MQRGLVRIACDESGAEGANLVGGVTDVFAHGGVRLERDAADACLAELRARIRSPAVEYKANHLLRGKNRGALVWLLGADGPLLGRASVYLVQKEFFATRRLAELLAEPGDDTVGTEETARSLYRDARPVLGPARWTELLGAFIALLWTAGRPDAEPADTFRHLAAAASRTLTDAGAAPAAAGPLRVTPGRLEAVRTAAAGAVLPPLDPLLPAVVHTVAHWSATGAAVAVVHDRQPSLTEERVRVLAELVAARGPGRLHSLRLAASRDDPCVQVADFLAGTARWIASAELNGRGDAELGALLRPYLDASSAWGDDASWAALRGRPLSR